MSAQTDFYLTLDRAAGLTLDATCAARAAGHKPLPRALHHRLSRVVRSLEKAQQDLYSLRNDPWQPQQQPKPKQLALPVS
jgi:hypothetical protein